VSAKISAFTGLGLEDLRSDITRLADGFQTGAGDELIAINARHAQALEQAKQALGAARQKLIDDTAIELMASDLREMLEAFGQISGKIDNEKILDQLFASFCIGK
jgi:tRNA modification GTPase